MAGTSRSSGPVEPRWANEPMGLKVLDPETGEWIELSEVTDTPDDE